MTQKDLRDIAAYWGAPCRFLREKKTVNWVVLHILSERVQSGYQTKNPITLFLRPISSLTDEECKTAFSLALPGKEANRFNRAENELYVSSDPFKKEPTTLCIDYSDGKFMVYEDDSDRTLEVSAGAVIAYLQSISVYVPGTIDEQYVSLI